MSGLITNMFLLELQLEHVDMENMGELLIMDMLLESTDHIETGLDVVVAIRYSLRLILYVFSHIKKLIKLS